MSPTLLHCQFEFRTLLRTKHDFIQEKDYYSTLPANLNWNDSGHNYRFYSPDSE